MVPVIDCVSKLHPHLGCLVQTNEDWVSEIEFVVLRLFVPLTEAIRDCTEEMSSQYIDQITKSCLKYLKMHEQF